MRVGVMGVVLLAVGCGNVDPGDNPVVPLIELDQDFFYCRIQPQVITARGCARGSGCHTRQSMSLDPGADTAAPPDCGSEDAVVGAVPPSYESNFYASQVWAYGSDPLLTEFYGRPTGVFGHPDDPAAPGSPVLSPDSCEAMLVVEWITAGHGTGRPVAPCDP